MMRLFFVLVALALPLGAQAVSLTVTPNLVPQGTSVTLTMTESNGSNLVGYRTGPGGTLCPPTIYDRPGGNLQLCSTFLPLCSSSGTPLAPCGSVSGQVNTACLAPGTWFLKVDYFLAGSFATEWACFTVSGGPNDPVLSAQGPAVIGTPLVLGIQSPTNAGAAYIVGLSATTNTGLILGPSLSLCLDDDALLQLSVLAPPPALLVNFVSLLDAAGNSPPIMINLPNAPALQCRGIHVQAVVAPTLAPVATNALSFTIM